MVRLLLFALATASVSCAATQQGVDLSLPGRVLPVVDGRIFPVAWRPLDHELVLFNHGETQLSEAQAERLSLMVEDLRAQPGMLVAVGFSRDGWSQDHTRVLAESRALSVRRVLLLAGLERERMQTVSVGEIPPPDWPGRVPVPQSREIGGWVIFGEMLIPPEVTLASAGEGQVEPGEP